jgi:hypothetical protein
LFPISSPSNGLAPAWLAELAEAVAGVRLGTYNGLEQVTPGERIALESRLRQTTESDPFWSGFLNQFLESP